MPTEFQPTFAYPDGSGWSGTDTSRERAALSDTTGKTGRTQQAVLGALARRGRQGATWRELSDLLATVGVVNHHGSVSGALSNLHRADRVAMLDERRNRCHVYVLPTHVHGRPTVPPRNNRPVTVTRYVCAHCGHEQEVV
jgi:hypothetical protein